MKILLAFALACSLGAATPSEQELKLERKLSDRYRTAWRKVLVIEREWRAVCTARGQVLGPVQGPEVLGCGVQAPPPTPPPPADKIPPPAVAPKDGTDKTTP